MQVGKNKMKSDTLTHEKHKCTKTMNNISQAAQHSQDTCWCTCVQTVAQHVAQMDYMRHAMKTKDGEIEVLKKKWQEYQDVQDRLSGYEKDRLGEKDLLRKRAEQIDALQHKVTSRQTLLTCSAFQSISSECRCSRL